LRPDIDGPVKYGIGTNFNVPQRGIDQEIIHGNPIGKPYFDIVGPGCDTGGELKHRSAAEGKQWAVYLDGY
jgi:hypothetical protein